jgi:membrane associated rhomboid family serine protease
MNYVVMYGIALGGGVIGGLVSLENQNTILAEIFAVIAVAGFIAACVWGMTHVARDRDRRRGPRS